MEFGRVTRRKAEVVRNDWMYGIYLTGISPSNAVNVDEDELPSVNRGLSTRSCENWDIDNIGNKKVRPHRHPDIAILSHHDNRTKSERTCMLL